MQKLKLKKGVSIFMWDHKWFLEISKGQMEGKTISENRTNNQIVKRNTLEAGEDNSVQVLEASG